jgi:hypothetical protein
LQLTAFMSETPSVAVRTIREPYRRDTGGGDRDPARDRARLDERFAEHRRWIGGDPDDPACRGFD